MATIPASTRTIIVARATSLRRRGPGSPTCEVGSLSTDIATLAMTTSPQLVPSSQSVATPLPQFPREFPSNPGVSAVRAAQIRPTER